MLAAGNAGRVVGGRKGARTTYSTNDTMRTTVSPVNRILITVVIKFTTPKIDDTPAT